MYVGDPVRLLQEVTYWANQIGACQIKRVLCASDDQGTVSKRSESEPMKRPNPWSMNSWWNFDFRRHVDSVEVLH